MRDFFFGKVARNDSDRLAARREHRVRDLAHQPDAPAAIHQAHSRAGKMRAKAFGRLRVNRAIPRARSAENADPPDRSEWNFVFEFPCLHSRYAGQSDQARIGDVTYYRKREFSF